MKKETCFYWGKGNHTTCTFILNVFMLLFDQSVRSRNRFCFGALSPGHNSSVLSFGETGDRDIFSAFIFGPCFNRPTHCHHGEEVSEKSSPNSVVPVLREV